MKWIMKWIRKQRKKAIIVVVAVLVAGISSLFFIHRAFGEQSGSSPAAGADSRIKQAFDMLSAKPGEHYGSSPVPDWEYTWGAYWDRIMRAAFWEPDGTATASDVVSGKTFYAGIGDRTIQTGTASIIDYSTFALQDYDDFKCSDNNQESNSPCAANDHEYTDEEGEWTLTATGGTRASVTDNGVTRSVVTNKVYRDERTGLYWSDRSNSTMSNLFEYVNGDDRTNPTGNSCNFNSPGTANAFCDTSNATLTAAEFCLNLELDADNADGDNNGLTGVETDWRLPTQKELLQAYINGAANNLPNLGNYFWASTELYNGQSYAWIVNLGDGYTYFISKSNSNYVRCVRGN